ncbi:hypothetical protein M8494_19985 [Serratia ureilytica]
MPSRACSPRRRALAQDYGAPEEVMAAVAAVLSLGHFRERTRCWACGWG